MSEKSRQRLWNTRITRIIDEAALLQGFSDSCLKVWPEISAVGFEKSDDAATKTNTISRPTENKAIRPDKIERDRQSLEKDLETLLVLMQRFNNALSQVASYKDVASLVDPKHGQWTKCANPNFACTNWATKNDRCDDCFKHLRDHGKDRRTVAARWQTVEGMR